MADPTREDLLPRLAASGQTFGIPLRLQKRSELLQPESRAPRHPRHPRSLRLDPSTAPGRGQPGSTGCTARPACWCVDRSGLEVNMGAFMSRLFRGEAVNANGGQCVGGGHSH